MLATFLLPFLMGGGQALNCKACQDITINGEPDPSADPACGDESDIFICKDWEDRCATYTHSYSKGGKAYGGITYKCATAPSQSFPDKFFNEYTDLAWTPDTGTPTSIECVAKYCETDSCNDKTDTEGGEEEGEGGAEGGEGGAEGREGTGGKDCEKEFCNAGETSRLNHLVVAAAAILLCGMF